MQAPSWDWTGWFAFMTKCPTVVLRAAAIIGVRYHTWLITVLQCYFMLFYGHVMTIHISEAHSRNCGTRINALVNLASQILCTNPVPKQVNPGQSFCFQFFFKKMNPNHTWMPNNDVWGKKLLTWTILCGWTLASECDGSWRWENLTLVWCESFLISTIRNKLSKIEN